MERRKVGGRSFEFKAIAIGLSKCGCDCKLTKELGLVTEEGKVTAREVTSNQLKVKQENWTYLVLACQGKAFYIVANTTGRMNVREEAWLKSEGRI